MEPVLSQPMRPRMNLLSGRPLGQALGRPNRPLPAGAPSPVQRRPFRSEYCQYYAFARRLARLCRIYGAKVLAIATLNLIDQWEFRGLDPETLHAVCGPVFNLEDRGDPPPLDTST